MIHDSKAYGMAYEAHDAAWKAFDAVRIKYRAGLIGDAEFINAIAQNLQRLINRIAANVI